MENNCRFYPVNTEAATKLREICEAKLKEEYGNNIPEAATKRLDQEFSWLNENEMETTVLLFKEAFERLGLSVKNRAFSGCQLLIYYLCKLTEVNPMKTERRFFTEAHKNKTGLEFRLPKGYAEKLAEAFAENKEIRAELIKLDGFYRISLIPKEYEENWEGAAYDKRFLFVTVVEWDVPEISEEKEQIVTNDGCKAASGEGNIIDFLTQKAENWPGNGEAVFQLPMMRKEAFCQVLSAANGEIKSFSDLARAHAFAHSNISWREWAVEKLKQKEISFKDIICCREDIMELLLGKGISFPEAKTLTQLIYMGKELSEEQKNMICKLGLSEIQEKMLFGLSQGYLWEIENIYDVLLKQCERVTYGPQYNKNRKKKMEGEI